MTTDQNLLHQPRDLSVASETSWTASEEALAAQIHLCNLNSKTDIEPELVAEFKRVFSAQPPEALAYAFACWREVSQYVPAISDIRVLVRDWHRNKAELAARAAAKLERERLEAARGSGGEVREFKEVLSDLIHIAQQPIAPTERQQRIKLAMERARLAEMPPGLILSPEQLAEIANPQTPEGIARQAIEREKVVKEVQRLQRLDAQTLDGHYGLEDV
jgi:hypothetical protein